METSEPVGVSGPVKPKFVTVMGWVSAVCSVLGIAATLYLIICPPEHLLVTWRMYAGVLMYAVFLGGSVMMAVCKERGNVTAGYGLCCLVVAGTWGLNYILKTYFHTGLTGSPVPFILVIILAVAPWSRKYFLHKDNKQPTS